MYCKNCGAELNANQAICLECGVKVGDGNKFCPNCGQPVNENQAICLSCGVALKQMQTRGGSSLNDNTGLPEGKDRITAAVLALFLGAIGIHNFYLGETKKGLVRIIASFICGIGAIIALIDLIKLVTGSYTWDPDAML